MASSIVTSATRQLGALLVQEGKSLYDVSDKFKRLQSDLEWMQCFLEDADNRQHQEKVVCKWVVEIRDIAYEAEDLIERSIHEVSHPRRNGVWNTIKWASCVFCDALTLHDVGSRIDDLRTRISELTPRLQMYGIKINNRSESLAYESLMWENRRTYSHIDEYTVGLKEHIEDVVNKLVHNNEVKVVGISGMGGLGKTTLGLKVYSHKVVRQHFMSRVWVYVSKQFNRRNVFEEILIGLMSTEDESQKKIKGLRNDELPRKICEVLEEKECLVVLDDVWSRGAWDSLKPAFESLKRSSSKLLITSRDTELQGYVDGSGYTPKFKLLNEDDSWSLLHHKAILKEDNLDAEVKVEMERLGKEMLKHCKGLPLAIAALGGILATKKTSHDWEIVSKNIRSYLGNTVREGGSGTVYGVLELSYYDLPFYLKPCFMYLGCYPEDYEISANELYHLWEAENLVTISEDEEADIFHRGVSLDDMAESYLNQLAARSMVQVGKRWPNGSIVSCRLHDVMRDMCLKKCRGVNFLNIIEDHGDSKGLSSYKTVSSSLVNRKWRRFAIHVDDFDPFEGVVDLNEAPYIRTLLLFSDTEKLLSRNTRNLFSLIRVLHLGGSWNGIHGGVIRYCIHLRYLSLRGDYHSQYTVSHIWHCKYLECLDLQVDGVQFSMLDKWRIGHSRRKLERLSDKFWTLERLRHLYLPSSFSLEHSRRKLRLTQTQLAQIETLVNFDVEQCEIEDLGKMTSLRTFSFTDEKYINKKDALEHLFKSPAITTNRLKSPLDLMIRANVINEEPTILTSLNPQVCINELKIRGRIEVPFGSASIQIFPLSLTRLLLHDCEIAKEGILQLEKLPKLEELQLEGTEAIIGSEMSFSEGGFKCLLKLTLFSMSELEKWEVGEGALPSLLYLKIIRCPKLASIPDGLPSSMKILCEDPSDIKGSEKYTSKEQAPASPTTDDGNKAEAAPEGNKEEQAQPLPPPPPPAEAEEPKPPSPFVLYVDLHCDGCAKKIERSITKLRGVEEVVIDMAQNEVTIKGVVEPQPICNLITKKTRRMAKVISPLPASDGDPIPELVVSQVSGLVTVELNVNMHCEECANQLKKKILKMRGVKSVETEFSSGKVTVTGTMDADKLVDYVYRRTKKQARIVPQPEPEKPPQDPKPAEEPQKTAEEEKKEDNADEKNPADGEAPPPPPEEGKKEGEEKSAPPMMYNQYNYYQPMYAMDRLPPPPQLFSDENPNACTIS